MLYSISSGKRQFINSLDKLRETHRPILVCYLPLGDPAINFDLAALYAECGVDVFEVGIPCKEPFMDGETICRSMQRVMLAKVSQHQIGRVIIDLKRSYAHIGIVVMGYGNMEVSQLVIDGISGFDAILKIAGPERCPALEMRDSSSRAAVDDICFVPCDMSAEAIVRACDASGYVMLQAAQGKTGMRDSIDESNCDKIAALKQAGVSIPIVLGFGISTAAQARAAIAMGADGVVIGSACVLQAERGEAALRNFLLTVRQGIDAVER